MAELRPRSFVGSSSFVAPSFVDLGVPAVLADVLAANGVTEPFPIQAATLPDSIAGRDVLGRGRTGSGKTYAFVLPVLARLAASRSRASTRPPPRADPGARPENWPPRSPPPCNRWRRHCRYAR